MAHVLKLSTVMSSTWRDLRRWWGRRARRADRPVPARARRRFLVQGGALLGGGLLLFWSRLRPSSWSGETDRPPVRPPTAGKDDARFRGACISCGLCGTVCENGCIRFFGADEPAWGALTPYLDVRRRSCTLCMRCTQIYPTGALSHTPAELDVIAERIHMGVAVVNPDRCLSYLGRVCGYCYDVCPLPGKAIKLIPAGKPVVLADGCVGCGRCVELCPQTPTAIDVRTETV